MATTAVVLLAGVGAADGDGSVLRLLEAALAAAAMMVWGEGAVQLELPGAVTACFATAASAVIYGEGEERARQPGALTVAIDCVAAPVAGQAEGWPHGSILAAAAAAASVVISEAGQE
jgi:hypothetical protein